MSYFVQTPKILSPYTGNNSKVSLFHFTVFIESTKGAAERPANNEITMNSSE